jgi:hypothetical protein
VAGVTGVDGPQLAVEVADDEHRQVVIDRPALVAAVDRKADLADAPRQFRGLSVGERCPGDAFQLVEQFAGEAIDVLLMLGRDRHAEEGRQVAFDHRRGVRVRDGQHEAVALDPRGR